MRLLLLLFCNSPNALFVSSHSGKLNMWIYNLLIPFLLSAKFMYGVVVKFKPVMVSFSRMQPVIVAILLCFPVLSATCFGWAKWLNVQVYVCVCVRLIVFGLRVPNYLLAAHSITVLPFCSHGRHFPMAPRSTQKTFNDYFSFHIIFHSFNVASVIASVQKRFIVGDSCLDCTHSRSNTQNKLNTTIRTFNAKNIDDKFICVFVWLFGSCQRVCVFEWRKRMYRVF